MNHQESGAEGLAQRIDRWLWQLPWPDRRSKRRLFKRLQRRGENMNVPFECDFFGYRYTGNLSNNIDLAVYFYGAFEKHLLFFLRDSAEAMRRHKRRAPCFFDIGANVGQHSLFMARYCQQVHAFEPFAEVSARLRGQMQRNQIENVQLHSVGLGERNESLPFFAPSGGNEGIGSFDADSIAKGNVEAGLLQVRVGDELIVENNLGPMDLVKMDVEGFEKLALEGLQQSLAHWRPLLVVEISFDAAQSFKNLDELRQTLPSDYHLFELNGTDGGRPLLKFRSKRARHSGAYWLMPFQHWPASGQADLVACPRELLAQLPGAPSNP